MKLSALALLLVSASAFAADVPSDLRLYNGDVAPVHVIVSCGDGVVHNLTIEARASIDVAAEELSCGAVNAKVESEKPIVITRMPRTEIEQQIVRSNSACDEVALQLPAAGCRFGVASAAVMPVAGASYSWAIEGGSFLSGVGTERVMISLGSSASTKVTVVIASPACTATATGVIALRDAATVSSLASIGGAAGTPVTITWTYPGTAPSTQALTGTDFPSPVVIPAAERSYTYTPSESGEKEVTLVASFAQATTRTRPSARVAVSASGCAAARATAKYRITECVTPAITFGSPTSVQAGSTFAINVGAQPPGAVVTWTVKNGTPSSTTGERITIKAGESGVVEIDARVTTGASCVAIASRAVTISPILVCNDPVASVSAGDFNCDGGTIKVSFTGTPPFTAVWNDGVTTTSKTAETTRFVSRIGTYTITDFKDAACSGTVTGSASFPFFTPTYSLSTADGSCETSTIVVRFNGLPPFTGTWSDGTTFTTSQKVLEHKPGKPGQYYLTFRDANCAGGALDPRFPWVNLSDAPTAKLSVLPYSSSCFVPTAGSGLQVEINGNGPHLITWSDGYIQSAPGTPAIRIVSPPADTTYSLVSVKTADCVAKVLPGSVKIQPMWNPTFQFDAPGLGCPGKPMTATLDHTMRPESTLTWSIQNGTITGGQGTPKVTFTPTAAGQTKLTATAVMGSCTMDYSLGTTVYGAPQPKMTLEPSTIPAGGTAVLSVTFDENTATIGYNNSKGDRMEPMGECVNHTCKSKYTNTTGPGQSTVTIQYTGQCYDGIHQMSLPLTITAP
jgi:hypothetical protein